MMQGQRLRRKGQGYPGLWGEPHLLKKEEEETIACYYDIGKSTF